jgi:formate dehydrogenase major subunit
MTNHWTDFKNTDVALICGSNAAENHPVSFSWLQNARDKRGAKIICVDPRFTRTAARADLYCPIRSGSNIAFWGGMIHHILENERYHKDYVVSYTNAASLIKAGYSFDASTGLFDSFSEDKRSYGKANWDYERDDQGKVVKDITLQHPRCAFQLMKNHYARYTPDVVTKATGAPQDKLLAVYDLFSSTGQVGKAGSILYAMGQTQFTSGSQNVRCMAIIQLLLGNMGLPGGGVNALRGHSNVQGSTDMALLFHLLPGYMPAPTTAWPTLAEYNATTPAAPSYWSNRPKFMASLLKAWYGAAATPENSFAYDFIPKARAGVNYSHMAMFENLHAGTGIKGLFVWGQNPVVAGPNSNMESKALENLDWLVCCDPFENETSAFWKRPGADAKEVKTEVFLLPMTTFLEKEGTVTHSGRLIQYRFKAVDGPGNVRQESYVLDRLVKRVKALYATSTAPQDLPIKSMTWDYPDPQVSQSNFIDAVMREINGKHVETGKLVPLFGALKEDGTTSCGNWIYSGMYTEEHGNRTKSRVLDDPGDWGAHPGWGFSWPANRRIIYNRASADPSGKPWSQERAYIWWDEKAQKWTGYDVPDFIGTVKPTDPLGDKPFIMITEREGRLFAIQGLNDGPFPEHYEPVESPVVNLINQRQNNPAHFIGKEGGKIKGDSDKFPIICSTWRVCEHFHTGAYSRNMPWLAELIPSSFVEIGEELARERGISNGEMVELVSARGSTKAVAMVTPRARTFNLDGKNVHQVGLTWHFGFQGLVKGEIANNLTPHVGDANTAIPEFKAFLVDVRKVTV